MALLLKASFGILCLLSIAVGSALAASASESAEEPAPAAQDASKAELPPGYDDTSMLPGSKWRVHDRRRPQPPMVAPGDQCGQAPADAIILFDGTDLGEWEGGDRSGIEDGAINIVATGELRSKRSFRDCQLHIEWMTPAVADGGRMNWGNSGVFLMDQFEVQIIESRDSHIYADGNSGAIYGQTPALVNASRGPGQWQSFDIVFTVPQFKDSELEKPAHATVFHNGIVVQYHQPILGATAHQTLPEYTSTATEGPIRLQWHGSAVRFRNIWVRPLQFDP